jgi:hypothetical protein
MYPHFRRKATPVRRNSRRGASLQRPGRMQKGESRPILTIGINEAVENRGRRPLLSAWLGPLKRAAHRSLAFCTDLASRRLSKRMLKVAPTPRAAAQQQPTTALRKPTSSRPPASSSRPLPASTVSATPSEQRKPSLKAPSSSAATLSVKRAAGPPAGTARALPSTSATVGTARKASGTSSVGGAGGSEPPEGRRARRVSATEEKQAVGSSARGESLACSDARCRLP